jgi:cytochrome P450
MEYNPYAAEVQHNPFPCYRWMRDEEPVYHNEALGFWALSRYDDVLRASMEPDVFVSGMGMTIEGLDGEVGNDILINKDEPQHTWHRRLVSRVFTPMAVASQEATIRAIARDMIDRVRSTGRMDVIQDLSLALPVAVICEMLGIPEEKRAGIHERSSRVLTMAVGDDGRPMVSDDSMAASMELGMSVYEVVAERAAAPGDDIISLLLRAEVTDDDGTTVALTPEQVTSRVVELVIAGHETTAKLIGNMAVALAWYPDERAKLAADPALIPAAVEEGLRWDGPSHYQGRWVHEPVTLHGVTIPAESRVVLVTGAASHDDREYPEPELFGVERAITRNVAFGWGIHLCVGQALARLETRIAFEELLAVIPEWELADGAVRAGSGQVRGHERLPIEFAVC